MIRPKLPRLPFSIDIGRAAFSILLSVVLYVVAVNQTNPVSTRVMGFTVPVEVVNPPSGLLVVDKPPPVQVRVSATQDVLDRLQPASFVAQVDASAAQAGADDLPVTVRSLDPGVSEVAAQPPRITLTFEAVQEQSLPVRVNVVGQVPTGYQLGSATADPPRITVSGASSVAQLAYEAVVDVSVDRVTVSINGVYAPRILDNHGTPLTGLTVQPPSVTVSVAITQQTQYKEVGITPQIQGTPAAGYVLQPATVDPPSVTLAGDPSALGSVDFVQTEPIDVTNATTTIVRRVQLQPASGTLLLQPGETVVVTIRVAPLTISTSVQVPVTVINLAQNEVLAQPPPPVTVSVTGPAPTLTNLTSRDFRVVVDLSGKAPGRYQVAPQVQNVPSGMSIDSVTPNAVSVTLNPAPLTPTPIPAPAASSTARTGLIESPSRLDGRPA